MGVNPPETKSLHLKMDGWKTSFLLGWPFFSDAMLVSESAFKIPRVIWVFPKIVVSPNHPFVHRGFPLFSPSILGVNTPIVGSTPISFLPYEVEVKNGLLQ